MHDVDESTKPSSPCHSGTMTLEIVDIEIQSYSPVGVDMGNPGIPFSWCRLHPRVCTCAVTNSQLQHGLGTAPADQGIDARHRLVVFYVLLEMLLDVLMQLRMKATSSMLILMLYLSFTRAFAGHLVLSLLSHGHDCAWFY